MDRRQRNAQVGRIHQAAKAMGLGDGEYRDLLETLTGCRTCRAMSDRQVNHAVDWMFYLSGRRTKRPPAFGQFPAGGAPHANLVRVAIAVASVVPPGYAVNPIRSPRWQRRVAGRACDDFGDFTVNELSKLIEGVKAVFARAGARGQATLDDEPLVGKEDPQRRRVAEEKPCRKMA